MAIGVIGASLPPALANSASPDRIRASASATASNPEGHADEIVVAFAQAPIRSAMTLAGACGKAVAQVLGETRAYLSWRTASKARSSTSIEFILTPMMTGTG